MTEQEIYALAERVARDYGANDLTQDAFVARAAIRLVLAQLAAAPVAAQGEKCWCLACNGNTVRTMMTLCPNCGNKRCPHASNHRYACTNSNEPGQAGSVY